MLLAIVEKKELSGVSLRIQGRVREMDPTTIISRLTEKAKEAIVGRFHDLREYQLIATYHVLFIIGINVGFLCREYFDILL